MEKSHAAISLIPYLFAFSPIISIFVLSRQGAIQHPQIHANLA